MLVCKLKHDRWRLVRVIAYFRLLLWWGGERMKEARRRWTPTAQVEERMNHALLFPRSEWMVEDNLPFCLVGSVRENPYRIIEMDPLSKN